MSRRDRDRDRDRNGDRVRQRDRDREREGWDSQGKRLHFRSDRDSRPDGEASPKKSRRDGKPATERGHSSNSNLEVVGSVNQSLKQHRRLKDVLPLEDPSVSEKKAEPDAVKKGSDKKVEGLSDGNKISSGPTEIPRTRYYFQHDERGNTGHGGQRFNHKVTEHGRWSDPKEQLSNRTRDKLDTNDMQKKDEKIHSRADEKNFWKHDGFYELEAAAEVPPARKRPAFRETKVLPESDPPTAEAAGEPVRLPHSEQPDSNVVRREERAGHYSRGPNKFDKPYSRVDERYGRRGGGTYHRDQRPGFQTRERYGAGGMRGRDRFNRRYEDRTVPHSGAFKQDKWKHDMFDEANRSPTPKNEEEQIAKVEALLAS